MKCNAGIKKCQCIVNKNKIYIVVVTYSCLDVTLHIQRSFSYYMMQVSVRACACVCVRSNSISASRLIALR